MYSYSVQVQLFMLRFVSFLCLTHIHAAQSPVSQVKVQDIDDRIVLLVPEWQTVLRNYSTQLSQVAMCALQNCTDSGFVFPLLYLHLRCYGICQYFFSCLLIRPGSQLLRSIASMSPQQQHNLCACRLRCCHFVSIAMPVPLATRCSPLAWKLCLLCRPSHLLDRYRM